MPYLTDKLERHLAAERNQFPIGRARVLENAALEIKRYSAFLILVKARAIEVSVKCNEALRCCVGMPAGEEREKRMSRFEQLNVNLQLDIESFYIFATIYLDKTSHFLEAYFGELRDCSFESFRSLKQQLDLMESSHGFKLNRQFREMAEKLFTDIVDFRDKKITHAKMPRLFRGLNWEADGRVTMASGLINAKPTDKLFQTTDVGDLWMLLEKYSGLFTEFVEQNPKKAKSRLNENEPVVSEKK